MQYFEQLGLHREPFSNSPDPEFLYYSSQHIACLQEIEIAVRLRRGLNVIVGEVGTGKTTLIRRFIKNMNSDDSMRLHLVLDPYFKSPHSFLRMLCAQVLGEMPDRRLNTYALKEMLKKELYRRGVERDMASVLIVDEGQKMTPECLEVLRELLNYETNNKKLLQILLFGQTELEPVIRGMENLMDRVNSYMVLKPLSLRETRAMIDYRLALSTPMGEQTPRLFTGPAYYTIHRATKGYPRKTVRLCHKVILNLLIRKKKRADMGLVRAVIQEEFDTGYRCRPLLVASVFGALLLVMGLMAVRYVPEVRNLAQGIESAVASQFATEQKGPSPFAPVIPESEPETVEDALEPAARSEAMTLDEYFADEDTEEMVVSSDAEVAEPSQETAEPKAEVTGNEDATPVEAPLNADEAARILGVADPAPVAAENVEEAAETDAVVPAISADVPAASSDLYELPKVLGKIPVMPQESLSEIIKKVYGAYDKSNLRKVIAANPHLRNVNDIEIGQPLILPVIEPGKRSLSEELVWVQVALERELDRAYGRMRAVNLFGFESRLMPYVAADGGLAFAVVLEQPFAGVAGAERARGKLPLALKKESCIQASPARDVSLAQMNDIAETVLQAKLSK